MQNKFSLSFLSQISHLCRQFSPTISWGLPSFFYGSGYGFQFLWLSFSGSAWEFQFQLRIQWLDWDIVFSMWLNHLFLAHTHLGLCSTQFFVFVLLLSFKEGGRKWPVVTKVSLASLLNHFIRPTPFCSMLGKTFFSGRLPLARSKPHPDKVPSWIPFFVPQTLWLWNLRH